MAVMMSAFVNEAGCVAAERVFYFGRSGKLIERISLDKTVSLEPNMVTPSQDLLSVYPNSGNRAMSITEQSVFDFVETHYLLWGKFGFEGDVIEVCIGTSDPVKHLGVIDILHFYQLMPHKPTLAADVVPIIYDGFGNAFVALGTRKYGKYAGSVAIIGGKQEVDGYYFQTPVACIAKEAFEEAGIKIEPYKDHLYDCRNDFYHSPMHDHVQVYVKFTETSHELEEGDLHLLKTYETSDSENRPHLGLKRVNWTTAYVLLVEVEGELTEERLMTMFEAGDDNSGMQYIKIGRDKLPTFGISHHLEIYADALEFFRNFF